MACTEQKLDLLASKLDLDPEKLNNIIDQINKNEMPKPGSYKGRLNSEPENIRKTLLGNKNA